jgi:glycosyltransferase involved in cell wall biosynthesis
VPPDDAVSFQGALLELASDHERRRAMGAAGRRWVEQAVSPAAVAQAYVDLIHEVNRRR